jgi:hypothetical protein
VASKTNVNVSKLARELGVSRATVYRRISKGEIELPVRQQISEAEIIQLHQRVNTPEQSVRRAPVRTVQADSASDVDSPREQCPPSEVPAPVVPSPTPGRLFRRPEWLDFDNVLLAVAALLLGLLSVLFNARYNAGFRTAWIDSWSAAAVGANLEVVISLLPSRWNRMWQNRSRLRAVAAFALYLPLAVYVMHNASGYAAQVFGDAVAGRNSIIVTAEDQRGQRDAAIKVAQDKVDAARETLKSNNCERRGWRDSCIMARQEQAQALEDLTKANAVPITPPPAMSDAAPGNRLFASVLRHLHVEATEDNVASAFNAFWLIVPILPGLLWWLVDAEAVRRRI